MRIVDRRELEIADHFGGDPAGAEFGARKARLIEHEDIAAMLHQAPRASAAGRAAANNDGFDVPHLQLD